MKTSSNATSPRGWHDNMAAETVRVSVVGDKSFTLGFKMAGVSKAYELDPEAFAQRVDEIMENEHGVLIVAGEHMDSLREKKRLEIQNSVEPVVIPITEDAEGGDLRSKIKQAIGVDIWS